jgi:hypothetical protein
MSRNPFIPTKDQTTEFGWGAGSFPRMDIDFSYRSGFPIADPDRRQQFLDLIAAKRTDLQNPAEPDLPAFQGGSGPAPMHYAEGNTERYGAQQPLVKQRRRPTFRRFPTPRKTHMQRSQDGGQAAAVDQAQQIADWQAGE